VGSRLTWKRLGRRLTEGVDGGGGTAAGIQARKWRSEGGTYEQRWGLPRGAQIGDGGGKKRLRRGGVIRLLYGSGRVRQRAVGVVKSSRHVEEAGHEQGGPCRPAGGARPTVALNRWAWATCAVRVLPDKQRRGEPKEKFAQHIRHTYSRWQSH
jgi:hypothetical protein